MINGCAYCIEMHADVAMKHGESAQALLALGSPGRSRCSSRPGSGVLALDRDEGTLIATRGHDADL